MISAHERADLIHILKMKHYALHAENAALLLFTKDADDASSVTINCRDNAPVMKIEQTGTILFSGTFKSIDDLKIFLEGETFRHYLN